MSTRGSAVAVAGLLVVIAAGLLWADRSPDIAAEVDAPRRVASIDAPGHPSTAAHSTPPAPDERATPRRAAIDRYLSDDRLLEVFEGLRMSSSGNELLVARRIEEDCHADTRAHSIVQAVLAGRPVQRFDRIPVGSVQAPDGGLAVTAVAPTPEQVDAARELVRRCEGFASRSPEQHAADRAALEARLLRAEDAVGIAENIATHRVPPTLDRLRAVLASKDPVAIVLLDDELTARWQRSSVQPMPTSLFGAPSPVMQLVGCDLGMDCTPTSRTALVGCLDQSSACGLDVHGQLLRGEAAAARRLIDDLRTRFIDAIVSGDYTIWGL